MRKPAKPVKASGEKFLIRFTPPSGGCPFTNGLAESGKEVAILPNAVRQAKRACKQHKDIPPYYVWLLCDRASYRLSHGRGIHHVACSLSKLASEDEVADFIAKHGEPPIPEPRARGTKSRRKGRRNFQDRGSQRRYKHQPYRDFAEDKPRM